MRTAYYRWRYRRIAEFGPGVKIKGKLRIRGNGRVVIAGGTTFEGAIPSSIVVEDGATVTIGPGGIINGLDVVASEAAPVTIGAEVVINRLQVVATHPVDIGDGCVFE